MIDIDNAVHVGILPTILVQNSARRCAAAGRGGIGRAIGCGEEVTGERTARTRANTAQCDVVFVVDDDGRVLGAVADQKDSCAKLHVLTFGAVVDCVLDLRCVALPITKGGQCWAALSRTRRDAAVVGDAGWVLCPRIHRRRLVAHDWEE